MYLPQRSLGGTHLLLWHDSSLTYSVLEKGSEEASVLF